MGRYTNVLKPTKPVELAMKQAENYLESEGFKKKDPAANVWKKGMGLMLGPQFVELEQQGEEIHLGAWIKFALLPGVYVGEMGITGAFGMIPKKKLKGRVEAIEQQIMAE